ncbi:MAG TPA: CDP-alcohol phosphatidyltransferase family protein, partial [bacterium]|nr:CDP-alcohol phosphatidyltransferase family protein [bacterium]
MQIQELWALERSLRSGRGDPLTHLFALQASFAITRLFIRLRLPADAATVCMFVTGCGAVVCLALGTHRAMALGAGLLLLAYVLDYVDGQVARYTGESSLVGAVKDRFAHVFVEFFALAAFGVGVWRLDPSPLTAAAGVLIVFWHVFRKLVANL